MRTASRPGWFLLLAWIALAMAWSVPARAQARMRPLAFATFVHDPGQDVSVEMLIDSIRTWGGPYRKAPVYVVLTDPKRVPAQRLRGLDVHFVELPVDDTERKYPFAAKACAAAKVEALVAGRVRSLAWFDPETLLLRPPDEMDLKDGAVAAVAPVTLKNCGQAPDEPVDAFWGPIYGACGIDPATLFTVETKVDGRTVRAWLNCGMFAVKPDRGLCRAWARLQGEFLRDAAFQRTGAPDPLHRIFLHQAVFTSLIAGRLRPRDIHWLGPAYNYPLFCHAREFRTSQGAYRVPEPKRAKRLDDLVSVFTERLFTAGPDWPDNLPPASAPLRHWLAEAHQRSLKGVGGVQREGASAMPMRSGADPDVCGSISAAPAPGSDG